MNAMAEKVSLQYGDAEISFYNIKIHHEHDDFKMQWHSHRYFELHFLNKGQCVYKFEQGDVTLAAGEMLIIQPECVHLPMAGAEESLDVVSLSVTQTGDDQHFYKVLIESLNKFALKPIPFSFCGIDTFEHTELYRSVLGVLKLKQVAADFTNQLFSRLLSNNNPTISSGKASAVLIDTLVNSGGITLDDIAKATNYSKRHITRLIKKTYGMTLSEFKRKAKERTQ